jgi:purine-binding chemotaxis protein CheW
MKFEDSSPNKDHDKKTITPQSAMDDYFDDMFGSSEEDPLKKLISDQTIKPANLSTETAQETLKVDVDKNQSFKLSDNSSAQNFITTPKLKPKKQVLHFNAPSFDEPELFAGSMSSLIIPAAFPKLAPVIPKTEISKPKVDVKLVVEVTNTQAQIVKPKLDAKTALASLEKQKSKLSTEQKQRLEAKLKLLSKEKSKVLFPIPPKIVIRPPKPVTIAKTVIETRAKKVFLETKKNEPTPELSTTKVSLPSASPELIPQKHGRPDWAKSRFECLIFSVAGLKLAVPLVSLGAIYKIEKNFIPLVGRASWFMGLYHHLERNVRVIDTAQWVMPERCSEEVRSGYKFIIRLGGNDWGMACDAVHQSIQLSPDQIKWRTERTKRAWLFGTVIDHMCALIDADSLSSLLNQQATSNPKIFS